MKTSHTLRLFLSLAAIALVITGCKNEGELVVDPNSSGRDQVSMIAVDGSGGGEILHYDESQGAVSQNAYQAANDAPLGMQIDNITEAYDQLFLQHRAEGKITVLDVKTQKKLGEIRGFPASADSGMCGLAFSNSTWAWVVCYNSDTLYLVDAKNFVIARRIKLDGRPTSVGTVGQKIFVGLQLPDGRGGAAVLSSNTGLYEVERVIPFSSPIIFAAPNYLSGVNVDGELTVMLLLSAGTASEQPTLHAINLTDFSTRFEVPFSTAALTSYIGKEPTFAAVSQEFFFYLATPEGVARTYTQGGGEVSYWLYGDYRVLAVDRWTDLLYASTSGSSTIHRITTNGDELTELTAPGKVKAIAFVSAYKTR